MSLDLESVFGAAVREAARASLGMDVEDVRLSWPPSAEDGDVATPVCFELARRLRKPPRAIAEAIATAYQAGNGIVRVAAAGAGYVNGFFDRAAVLRSELLIDRTAAVRPEGGKVIVEHTNINPNKAAHIGHVRNAVLGDTLVRCLRRLGRRVEVQNYIDDTGVQLADVVVGFRVVRGEELAEVERRYSEESLRARGERFDYVCWDVYAEVTGYYEEDASRLAHREETLKRLEEGGNPVAAMGAHIARRIERHHLRTMHRIGVAYDLLPRESDILGMRFWEDAFARLRAASAIRFENEGKNAGCWVMDVEGTESGVGEDQKIIVRSNGTVTYVGKDIAYQMWKFGLLGKDFRYSPFDWSPWRPLYPLWSTSTVEAVPEHPAFGGGETVYNVIDVRQSYLQRVVAQGLRALGHDAEAERSIHFSYEVVALTPAAVAALFPEMPLSAEDRARPFIEMSGRRGIGVRADDLIDALIERATPEVKNRNPDLSEDDVADIARRIAVGALRYYMLRYTLNRVVAFDFEEALAFEGETGPYLQYSVVRAKNILRKVAERFGDDAVSAERLARDADLAALPEDTMVDHWEIVLRVTRIPAALRNAVDNHELALVARDAHALAQAFNSFYHKYPVLQEDDDRVRDVRLAIVRLYHDALLAQLGVLGIEEPLRM
jgi:arginyl-tRNA synthetase